MTISRNDIINWCSNSTPEKPYYRPFICKGDISKADTFLVGINPATPIYPKDINLNSYIDLLLNYEKFTDFYKGIRILNQKHGISRTRIGINSFVEWLSVFYSRNIVETNVIPYPTKNTKELWNESSEIIERAKTVFWELLMIIQPKVIILHGKVTVNHFIDLLKDKEIQYQMNYSENTINQMESNTPLLSILYSEGKVGLVLACRHLMYYGKEGKTYDAFKENIIDLLKIDNRSKKE